MEEIRTFLENALHAQIVKSVVILVSSIILYKILIFIIKKGEKSNRLKLMENQKRKTYIKLIKSIIRYVFVLVTILILLQTNGIDVSSVLAGVGVLGVIFGLAIQDWLKDIIRGSSILSDQYFAVEDIVKYNDIEGRVLVIGLKTTKIQDLATGNVISIANRRIEEIQKVSNLIYINIPMPYEVPVETAEKAINDIIENIKTNNNTEGCRYLSVNKLDSSSINYLIEVTCNPLYKLQVRRDAHRSILVELANNNIAVPYNQLDIHTK